MQYMLTHATPEIILPPHDRSALCGMLDLLNFTLNTLGNLTPSNTRIPTIKQVFGDTLQEMVQMLCVFIGA